MTMFSRKLRTSHKGLTTSLTYWEIKAAAAKSTHNSRNSWGRSLRTTTIRISKRWQKTLTKTRTLMILSFVQTHLMTVIKTAEITNFKKKLPLNTCNWPRRRSCIKSRRTSLSKHFSRDHWQAICGKAPTGPCLALAPQV